MTSFGSLTTGSSPSLPLDSRSGLGGYKGEERSEGMNNDSGGAVNDVSQRSSVYSSTSYATSRGFRPPSGGDHNLSQPKAPPRTRGKVVKPPSRGIKKSSSEVLSLQEPRPSTGILKSSSGVLISQHANASSPRSSSESAATNPPRVAFSSEVVTSDGSPPSAAAAPVPSRPVVETHSTGPSGRTLTRQPEGPDKHGYTLVRLKTKEAAIPERIPRTTPLQREPDRSPQQFAKYPQAAEAPAAAQFPGRSPHSQPRSSDFLEKQHTQEQGPQQIRKEKDSASLQSPLKSHEQQEQQQRQQHQQQYHQYQLQRQQKQKQQTKNAQDHGLVLSREQNYADGWDDSVASTDKPYGERKQLESVKKEKAKERQGSPLQKSPTIDIPVQPQRTDDDPRSQYYQQLVRAGSLGSGEPAAILEQRRSRSPLPTPGRAHPVTTSSDSKYASPLTRSSLPEKNRGSVTVAGGERKPGVDRSQDLRDSREGAYPHLYKSVAKSPSRASDATRPAPAANSPAAGAIRAAAKAYTENFQTYSFSGYLTKSRKDSLGAKEDPPLRDYADVELEAKAPAGVSSQQESADKPLPAGLGSTHAHSGRGQQQPGKIIVPLTSFVLASKSSEPVTNIDKVVIKQPLSGETAVIKVNAPETKETPVAGTSCNKPGQGCGKGEGVRQDKRIAVPHPQPGATQHQQQTSDLPSKVITRDKHPSDPPTTTTTPRSPATSTSTPVNKKPPRSFPPFVSGLRHSRSGENMKGNNEGALLVACRIGEEDQVLRLMKELTAAGVLDATALNQADRSGRTALSYSCANAFQRVVEALTGLPGIDINKSDTDGNTPLHFASQAGHTEVVSHLVNKCNRSVDLDARNALGFTPLMKAALQGRTKIAKILLFAGASPHLRDFGRGLCAVEWARYTGRHVCSELIDSVQKSCSSHIRDRWTSDPDLKSHSSTSLNTLGHGDKESWIKHKIKKAFHKSESKKEFSVVTNLSTMAMCATSPLLPTAVASPELKQHQMIVPHVQVTEVKVPDCYEDPEDALSRLPPPPVPPVLPADDVSPRASSPTSSKPKKQTPKPGSPEGSSSASPPSSPPPSSPPSTTKPISPTAAQSDASAGETRANGGGKVTSHAKTPLSNIKKKK